MRKKVIIGVVGILIAIGIAISVSYYLNQTKTVEVSEEYYLKDIPAKPSDYDLIRREVERGYVDLSMVSRDYYLQPDFYPGWKVGQEFYTKHDYTRWGVFGSGAYPANPEVDFETNNVGAWISFTTFYKAGYGIEAWQGIKLVPSNSEYFDVTIEPNEFLLEPTFPFFRDGWVQPILINITIKKTPPSGEYNVIINAGSPSQQHRKEWVWKVIKTESTEEERFMLEQAEEEYGGKIPDDWEGWIIFERRNRYVDASLFSMGERIQVKIVVE